MPRPRLLRMVRQHPRRQTCQERGAVAERRLRSRPCQGLQAGAGHQGQPGRQGSDLRGSSSQATVLEPAGLKNATGLIAAMALKLAGDPAWDNDAGMKEYLAFMKQSCHCEPRRPGRRRQRRRRLPRRRGHRRRPQQRGGPGGRAIGPTSMSSTLTGWASSNRAWCMTSRAAQRATSSAPPAAAPRWSTAGCCVTALRPEPAHRLPGDQTRKKHPGRETWVLHSFRFSVAPRPGLEPGTYGLTVPGDGTFWDLLIQVAF